MKLMAHWAAILQIRIVGLGIRLANGQGRDGVRVHAFVGSTVPRRSPSVPLPLDLGNEVLEPLVDDGLVAGLLALMRVAGPQKREQRPIPWPRWCTCRAIPGRRSRGESSISRPAADISRAT